MLAMVFFQFPHFCNFGTEATRICVKCCSIDDIGNFDVFHFEILSTGENDVFAQSGVVGVKIAKRSPTVAICAAIIPNINVSKVWTPFEITPD
jgi:hypothetical protein